MLEATKYKYNCVSWILSTHLMSLLGMKSAFPIDGYRTKPGFKIILIEDDSYSAIGYLLNRLKGFNLITDDHIDRAL